MKATLKWNWGTGIALTYITFAVMIIVFVVNSFKQQIDLVTPDYYAKELAFQKQIEREQRSRSLKENISWMMQEDALELTFPAELKGQEIKGEMHLFCPTNAKQDQKMTLQPDANGKQLISLQSVIPGRYKVQIQWSANGLEYYKEGVIVRN